MNMYIKHAYYTPHRHILVRPGSLSVLSNIMTKNYCIIHYYCCKTFHVFWECVCINIVIHAKKFGDNVVVKIHFK